MEKRTKLESKINCTIESIKIIEDQIRCIERRKPVFFRKKKIQEYNERIDKLECVKRYLCKRLEYKVDDDTL